MNAIESVTAKESVYKTTLQLTKLMVNITQAEQAGLQRNLLYGTTQNNKTTYHYLLFFLCGVQAEPKNVVLVHGEAGKMDFLKQQIEKEFGKP